MKNLRLLFLLAFLSGLTYGHAQTAHNTKCMRCKYSKYNLEKQYLKPVKGRALDECACTACGEKSRKEHAARQAEEKKRIEVLLAKQKAESLAKEAAFKAEQQRKREEAERKKQQEEKDRIAREALMKKYRDLADKGKISVKPGSENTIVETELPVTPFVKDDKKTYGFKLDTVVVFEKPFTDERCSFYRIEKTNYFLLQLSDKDYKTFRFFILNAYGVEQSVNGTKEFSAVMWPRNQISVFTDTAQPEFVRNWATVDFRGNMYADKSSAITEITRPRSGYSFGCEDNYVVPSKQFVLGAAFEIEQEITGYRIFSVRATCNN